MRLSPGLTRGRRRAVGLAVLAGVLVVTAGSFARASGAGGTAVSTPSAVRRVSDGRGRPVVGLPALPGLEPGGHGPAQPDGRRSRRVARQEPGRDDVGVRRRHRRAARLPRQARLPAGLDRPDVGRRRQGAGRDGRDRADGARGDARREDRPCRRRPASARSARPRDGDAQGHARRLLPELVRHVALGRGEVERRAGERRGAARHPRLPGDRAATAAASTAARRPAPAGATPPAARRRSARPPARCSTSRTPPTTGRPGRTASRRTCRPISTTASTCTTSCSSSSRSRRTTRRRRSCRSSCAWLELRHGRDARGDGVPRHAAAVPGRLPARLLHAVPDARGRHGDDPGAARGVPGHHAADPGHVQDERLPAERDGVDGLLRADRAAATRGCRARPARRRPASRLPRCAHAGTPRTRAGGPRDRPQHLEVRPGRHRPDAERQPR